MIKVNLLRDVTGGTYGPSPSGVGVESGGSQDSLGGNMDLIVKVIFFVVPILLVVVVRSYMINIRQNQVAQLQAQEKRLEENLKNMEPGLKDIEKFQEEKKKLDSQLDVIRKLSKERLKNVKSLDALQGIIPAKAWLSKLKITGDKLELEGFAVDDIVISDFLKDLGSSIYFVNVTLESAEEAKADDGTVKKFVIKCNLENF